MFKLDFYYRCEKRLKDDLSKEFQQIYKDNPKRIRLKEDILSTWQKYNSSNHILNEIYSILKYRHWIAHGRYFLLKVNTTKYDFNYLYVIAKSVIDNFQLYLD